MSQDGVFAFLKARDAARNRPDNTMTSLAQLQAMEMNRRKMKAEDELAQRTGQFRTRMAGDEFRTPAIPAQAAQEAVYGDNATTYTELSPAREAVAGVPAQFNADMAYQAALQAGVPSAELGAYQTLQTNTELKREAMLAKFEAAKLAAADKNTAASEKAAALLREQTNRGEDRDADRELRAEIARNNVLLAKQRVSDKLDSAQVKLTEKQELKAQAKEGFNTSIDFLIAQYESLDKLGGIVNPKAGAFSNVGSRLASSWGGQVLGGTFGTQEQKLRDDIMGTIPLLVLDIKNVTGASAQQMNSNVELQNFLRAASSPSTNNETVLLLLNNLKLKYTGVAAIRPNEVGGTIKPSGATSSGTRSNF